MLTRRSRRQVASRARPPAAVGMAIATAVICAAVAAAQQPETPRRAFFEPVEVPLVSVDVYVVDSEGRPVAGLQLEDFEVREDGEIVRPTHFYAAPGARGEAPDAPPASEVGPDPEDRLHIAVWIDETAIRPEHRRSTLEHVASFVSGQVDERIRVMLASYDGATRIRVPFTRDRTKLEEGLERLVSQGGSSSRLAEQEILLRQIQNTAIAENAASGGGRAGGLELQGSDLLARVRSFAEESYQRSRHTLASLDRFVRSMSGLPGQKVVLLVSDGFEVRSGERLFAALQRMLGSAGGLDATTAFAQGRRYDLSRELRDMARRANSHRVTFLTLSSMVERSLGLASAEGRGGSAADVGQIVSTEQAMLTMAGATGGTTLDGSGSLPRRLAEVAEQLGAYYSIGYPPPTPGDGAYHRLDVRVQREGVTVRHREGYHDTGDDDALADLVLSAAVLQVADNPLDVTVEARAQQERDDGSFLVPVLVRIPIGELVLVPGPEEHQGRVSIALVVRSADGGLSEIQRHTYPVTIPNAELTEAIGSQAGYTLGLVMRPGPHRVAVAVRDEMAGTEAAALVGVDVGGTG